MQAVAEQGNGLTEFTVSGGHDHKHQRPLNALALHGSGCVRSGHFSLRHQNSEEVQRAQGLAWVSQDLSLGGCRGCSAARPEQGRRKPG